MVYYDLLQILRDCVKVARVTLTHFVWVRILFPQPKFLIHPYEEFLLI